MRHCLPDPEALENLGSYVTAAYSCEYDDGKRVRTEFVRLGEDGKIFFMLCESCKAQMNAQVLEPMVMGVLSNRLPSIVERILSEKITQVAQDEKLIQGNGEQMVYRDFILTCRPGFEMPPVGSENYVNLLNEIDNYIDHTGKVLRLRGLQIEKLQSVVPLKSVDLS